MKRCWSVLAAAAGCLVALHLWTRSRLDLNPQLQPQPQRRTCSDVFSLSAWRQRWETDPPPAACQAGQPDLAQVKRCLGVARPNQTEPDLPGTNRIVFVGDSRLRIIFSHLLERLGVGEFNRTFELPLDDVEYYRSINITRAPDHCFDIHRLPLVFEGEQRPRRLFFCSLQGGGGALRLEFWWRVYVSALYRRQLADLADQCQSGLCPRLVLLDSGLWYARRFDLTESASAADWALRFRADLSAALEGVRRLAALVPVLWKLDEPEFHEEVGAGRPGIVMPTLTVLQAAVYSQLADVPGLNVWSSLLPLSVDFYRTACWRGRRLFPDFPRSPLFSQCANEHHVGRTVLTDYTDILFSYLCPTPS